MKRKVIEVEILGEKYVIEFIRDIWFNRHKLNINGNVQIIENNLKNSFVGIDIPIKLGDIEVRFVKQGNYIDIALDGIYVNSLKEYKPVGKMPAWNWFFIVANGIIPLLTLGGAIPVMLAFIGIYSCTRVSVRAELKFKLLINVFITLMAYAISILFLYSISGFN